MNRDHSLIEQARRQGLGALTTKQIDLVYEDLETELLNTVADFGVEELSQMIEAAEAIRHERSTS